MIQDREQKTARRLNFMIGCGIALLVTLVLIVVGINYLVNFQPPANVIMPGIIVFFVVIPGFFALLGLLWKLLPAIIREIKKRL